MKVLKRMAIVCMAFMIMLSMMPLLGEFTGGAVGSQIAYAESEADVNAGGCGMHLWYADGGASVAVWSYKGGSEVALPSSVSYGGTTYKASDGDNWFFIEKSSQHAPFAGNNSITKVAIPSGYGAISSEAFAGCTGLVEMSIGSLKGYQDGFGLGQDVFKGCTNLKTYNIDSTGLDPSSPSAKSQIINAGIGTDASGNPIAGVEVWTQEGGAVWAAITELNESRPADKQIILHHSADPYSRSTVSGSGGGSTDQKGEDGTPYGKGASESVVNKAITGYAKETDPKGTVFGLLKARLSKVTKSAVTLQWSKVSGAKKYVVYGNACGAKNKMKKLTATGKTKLVFKKVNGKKVKKGTYYKFIVVALDGNNRVVSTSKIVHAATTGGKVGNDKAVKTKAKKDKVTLKKGKTFKLGAKPVPKSKKLKVKRHRGIAFESSNTKVATVSKKGVIKAVGKGTCKVYVYAQNGVFKTIKVTVK